MSTQVSCPFVKAAILNTTSISISKAHVQKWKTTKLTNDFYSDRWSIQFNGVFNGFSGDREAIENPIKTN
jgi:hypothetical protein